MLIDSLYMVSNTGDIILEKHWQEVVPKTNIEYLISAIHSNTDLNNVPPIIMTPYRYLINVFRSDVFFVAIISNEISPLFVIEFLHRTADIIVNYFDGCSENLLKDQTVIIYELLDEMLDAGFPFATETNLLKELIKPPNLLRTLTNSVTGRTNVSEKLPTNQMSTVPWRKLGIKYNNNEAYFDVTEELDAIIDKRGNIICAEINGSIDCVVKLSGMPDLSLTFVNSRLFDDVSFHPCVRHKRWDSNRLLSFLPPDGHFRLMTYHIGTQSLITIPIFVKHSLAFKDPSTAKIELQVGPKRLMGKMLENVAIEITMPKNVVNVNLNQTQGKYSYNSSTRLFVWDIGKLDTKPATLKGPLSLQSNCPVPDFSPSIMVKFVINQVAMSDVRVNRLDMFGEKYKPFKGVKYITRSGVFQIRT